MGYRTRRVSEIIRFLRKMLDFVDETKLIRLYFAMQSESSIKNRSGANVMHSVPSIDVRPIPSPPPVLARDAATVPPVTTPPCLSASSDRQMWILLLSMIATIVSWDLLVYQTSGGAVGWACFTLILAGILFSATFSRSTTKTARMAQVATSLLLLLLAARSYWQWNPFLPVLSGLLLAAFALSVHGLFPWVDRLLLFLSQVMVQAFGPLGEIVIRLGSLRRQLFDLRWREWGFPTIVCLVFAAVFLFANPAALTWVWNGTSSLFSDLASWLGSYFLLQILCWCFVGIIALGMMVAPKWIDALERKLPWRHHAAVQGAVGPMTKTTYRVHFNTLLSVIVLFSIYLFIEFANFWFREFPEGFQYSGYAHRGAAWLTVALAVATFLLSWIFRVATNDQHKSTLHRLTWIWSGLNLLLACSVYNRMWIYVQFNGMTRMRIIGYFGITCVVVGFALVLIKIVQRKSFVWLIQRELIAMFLFLIFLSVTPLDMIAYNWNRASIASGLIRPSVQIVAHSLSPEGYQAIIPLMKHENEVIREGVTAMLAKKLREMSNTSNGTRFRAQETPANAKPSWAHFQASESQLKQTLDSLSAELFPYIDNYDQCEKAIDRLSHFAMQWY